MQRKIIASTRADTQTPAYRTYDWKARPNPEQITPRPLPKHTPTINHEWLRVRGWGSRGWCAFGNGWGVLC